MVTICSRVPLAPLTALKIGGPAEYFVAVKSPSELASAVANAKKRQLPITVLGGGSNVLVDDAGIPGLVIHNLITGLTEKTDGDDVLVCAQAGEEFDALVNWCTRRGYSGLENLSHIPGSVGAAPIQNVGAYGVEIKDLVTEVEAYNIDTGTIQKFNYQECQFSYRYSWFKTPAGRRFIITSVTYRLSGVARPNLSYPDLKKYFSDNPKPTLTQIRQAVIKIRRQKFPDWRETGTAGSFFKNPIITASHYRRLKSIYPDLPGFKVDSNTVKVPLGYVIDKICNYKGVKQGPVATYQNQALVIVNCGGATALEVSEFACEIVALVKTKTDIDIEWEITALPDTDD